MSDANTGYKQDTRHAVSCTLFVLPMLIAYEMGVWSMTDGTPDMLRNGADSWLRWLFTHIGLTHSVWPGIVFGLGLLLWCSLTWQSRPKDPANVWMGMVIESATFALLLWVMSLCLGPLLDYMDIPLQTGGQPEPAMQMMVAYLGAGIYEEAVFRLLAFTLLIELFKINGLPESAGTVLAVCVSALLFAAAHHVGPVGEPFDGFVFLFRTLAGVYFALLYRFRGFGIAVGAHAFYDIFIGVILTSS